MKKIRDIRIVLDLAASNINRMTGQFPVWYHDAVEWLEKQGEQKPAEWSKEGEKIKGAIYSCIDSHYNGLAKTSLLIWLEFLKDRIQPYSQWKPSDEQMKALRRMKAAIAGEGEIYEPLNSLYEDLKKLREE